MQLDGKQEPMNSDAVLIKQKSVIADVASSWTKPLARCCFIPQCAAANVRFDFRAHNKAAPRRPTFAAEMGRSQRSNRQPGS